MKKFLSLLACLAIVLSCCIMGIGTVAFAAEESPEADFLVFDGVLEEYIGPGGDIVIPASLGVTEVASYAFANNLDITSIVFPEGCEIIGYRACYQSTNITAVTLPYSLYELGAGAFHSCNLSSILIPGNCEIIQFGTFSDNVLNDIKFSYGVREIHTSSFSANLCSKVIFPETVELICGFSFVFPKDTGVIEFTICNPDCEIGYQTQGIKENNEHSWSETPCSISYSAINKTQSVSYVVPEGSSMIKMIEGDFRDHLASTKGTNCDVSSNKLIVKEKPQSYFDKLEENQEGYGTQKPSENGSGSTGEGGTGGENGNGGDGGTGTGNGNGTGTGTGNGTGNGSTTYVTQPADNSSMWIILAVVGVVVLLIIVGVVVFLVIYTKKSKAAPMPQVMYMMGPDGKPVPMMMGQPMVAPQAPTAEAPAAEAETEEAPAETSEDNNDNN